LQLNDEEQRILDGARGYMAQKCMQFLVAYGEAAGAERLVDIDGTVDIHPNSLSWVTNGFAITQEEVEELARKGERFKVPTYGNKPVNPGFIIDGWETCGTRPNNDPEYHKKCMEKLKPLIQMGMVPTLSCDYYLVSTFWPTKGQHCSWGESSAIPWCNAVLGARTNFDGCFQSAYLGKIPYYDLHVPEKRLATVLVQAEKALRNDMEYDLFGWAVGEACGMDVPAIVGVGSPKVNQLVKMNSALCTGGQVRMYHIVGVTPEAPTLEATKRGPAWAKETVIGNRELRAAYDLLNTATTDDVDFVYLGCPHYSIEEVQKVARLLEGKKCRIAAWVMTNPATFRLAEEMGYRAIIERAGANLLSGSCACELRGEYPPAEVFATDAAKQAYYIKGHAHPKKLGVCYGTTEDCVRAAVTGKWQGEWREA
jgi:predicted aconitase